MGCVGGSGVNIYRLYLISHSHQETRPSFDTVYYAQFAGLILLGGAFAWANDATKDISPLTAIYIGLSVPAVIKVAIEPARRRKPSSPKRIN
jgi:hypothetical protein